MTAPVRVKPLVWEEDGYGNLRAKSVRGGEGVDRMIEPQVIGDDRVTYEAWGIKDSFDNPVAAMSAVEVEISAEILAALEPQPDPRDEVIARLGDALRNLLGIAEDEGIVGDKTTLELARAALAAAKAVQHG